MRLKNSYFFTLRENAKDEDSQSSNLLVRAGMIKKSSTGVYMILPMGLKVFNKIKSIIQEEMEAMFGQIPGAMENTNAFFDSRRSLCCLRKTRRIWI